MSSLTQSTKTIRKIANRIIPKFIRDLRFNTKDSVEILNIAGKFALPVYIYSMGFYPLIYCGDKWIFEDNIWQCTQHVWNRWQTLNAGVFALVASMIAFNISRQSEKDKTARRLKAARAMLTHSLSYLTEHNRECARLIISIGDRASATEHDRDHPTPPEISESHLDIIQQFITHGSEDEGGYFLSIITQSQIIQARTKSLARDYRTRTEAGLVNEIGDNIVYLASFQAKIDRAFDYAREEESLNMNNFTEADFNNALNAMEIVRITRGDFRQKIQNLISRGKNTATYF